MSDLVARPNSATLDLDMPSVTSSTVAIYSYLNDVFLQLLNNDAANYQLIMALANRVAALEAGGAISPSAPPDSGWYYGIPTEIDNIVTI